LLQIDHHELINGIIGTGIFRRMKRFGYIRCDITLSLWMDSTGR